MRETWDEKYATFCFTVMFLLVPVLPLSLLVQSIQNQLFEHFYIQESWRFSFGQITFGLLFPTFLALKVWVKKSRNNKLKLAQSNSVQLNNDNALLGQTSKPGTVNQFPIVTNSTNTVVRGSSATSSNNLERYNIFFKKDIATETQILKELISQIKASSKKHQNKKILGGDVLMNIAMIRPKTKSALSAIAGVEVETMKFSSEVLKKVTIFDLCVNERHFGFKTVSKKVIDINTMIQFKQSFKINYMSGSNPGQQRVIMPLYLNEGYVWARCEERENEIRCFKIDSIVMAPTSSVEKTVSALY